MRIAVCMKTVIDPQSRIELGESGRLRSEHLRYELNEYDLYAVEEAIRLAERGDGEVVLVTVGTDNTTQGLRKGLAMGAGRAIRIDCAPDELDAFGTATLLAAALRAVEPDLVLAGVESDDLGSSQVGVLVAEQLGYASATLAIGVEPPQDGSIRVRRELEGGTYEHVQVDLPAVLTIQSGINEPRYPSLKGIMAAKRKELAVLSPEDVGLEQLPANRVATVQLAPPPPRERAKILEGPPEQVAAELVRILRQEEKVL